MVAEELQRNDVQQALETVDGLWDADRLGGGGDRVVVVVADDDRLSLAGGYLGKGGLHLCRACVT